MCIDNVEINQYIIFKSDGDDAGFLAPLSSGTFVEAFIDHIETRVLVDAGTEVSGIWRDLWQRLKCPLFFPNNITFRTANGSSMTILGRSIIDFGVMGRNVWQECNIAENINHGADFLQENEAIFDYSSTE